MKGADPLTIVPLGGATMILDPDTFLTAVYCIVDDLYKAHLAPHRPRRRGPHPVMSDSEVLTLTLLAQWHPSRQETTVLRFADRHWRAYFPHLLEQSAFNRRSRDLCGALARLAVLLAPTIIPHWHGPLYGALDAVPVPLMRRCRGQRHRLFADEAGIGYGGSDRDWYYGMHLLTAVNDTGAITGFLSAPASTDVRWITETWWRWQQDPHAPLPTPDALQAVLGASHGKGGERRGVTGAVMPTPGVGVPHERVWIADRGFRGAGWRQHWQQVFGVRVRTRADGVAVPAGERQAWDRWVSGLRQVVEQVHQSLTTLGIAFPRARSWWGVQTRLGAKVAAHNLLLRINQQFDRPLFTAFDPFG